MNLTASTLAPTPNSSYLVNTGKVPVQGTIDGSTMGLMMLLSTLQYQAPYMNPAYSNAASQAGKAAFVQVGGQGMQDKLTKYGTDNALHTAHDIGLTDTEMGIVGETYKIYRQKQIDVRGPNIYPVNTHLTINQNSATLGFKWSFK
jgi:hypothetical protein